MNGTAWAIYAPDGGMHEMIGGSYLTVTEAQIAALAYGAAKVGDYRKLYWRQFSETTWGLMNGELYTYVSVRWTPASV